MKLNGFIFFLLFFCCFSVGVKGQNKVFKNYEAYAETTKSSKYKKEAEEDVSISLGFDYELAEFHISKSIYSYDTVLTQSLMKGTFERNKDTVAIFNPMTKKKYELKIIDHERLLNINLPYLNDTLYIILKAKDGYKQFMGRWMDGKKNAKWFFFKNGKLDHTKLYEDGVLIQNR